LNRIREIKRMATEDEDDATRQPWPAIVGEVAFTDVSFEYNDDTPVLKHVSFRSPAGSTTALVGSSGSGKSTLISLVMAFNRPIAAAFLSMGAIGICSAARLSPATRRGLAGQFSFRRHYRREHWFLSSPRHPRGNRAVSRVAHCEEFINGFADGYDTIVGERGVKLSGGQRQRGGHCARNSGRGREF